MILNLHLICHRPNNVGAHMAAIVKRLQPPPHSRPLILHQLAGRFICRVANVHGSSGVGVDPLFYLDGSRAVVELVGDVCGLGADVADLAEEGDLGDFDVVDFEVGVWVRLGGVEDLFDGAGPEGVFVVGALGGQDVNLRWELGWDESGKGWKDVITFLAELDWDPPWEPPINPPPPIPP